MVGGDEVSSEVVKMVHGAGGAAMQEFIRRYILRYLDWGDAEVPLNFLDDSGVSQGIVLKSDGYTVKPLFFPGGDIGRLAVAGSVNDILMVGGEPVALATGMILEEGFPLDKLEKIMKSIAITSREAGAPIITGDTKVVERGGVDEMVINMSGFGVKHRYLENNYSVLLKYGRSYPNSWILDKNIRPGDKIILSGYLGDHAIALLSARENLGFKTDVKSDVAPLNSLISKALEVGGVVAMKDPTRGGLANLLNEWCEKSGYGIYIKEEKIPVREAVRSACEYLGLDFLELGNEGKAVIAVIPEMADDVLAAIREDPRGRHAEIIGEVTDEYDFVVMETMIGGLRIVSPPIGDPVPRIC